MDRGPGWTTASAQPTDGSPLACNDHAAPSRAPGPCRKPHCLVCRPSLPPAPRPTKMARPEGAPAPVSGSGQQPAGSARSVSGLRTAPETRIGRFVSRRLGLGPVTRVCGLGPRLSRACGPQRRLRARRLPEPIFGSRRRPASAGSVPGCLGPAVRSGGFAPDGSSDPASARAGSPRPQVQPAPVPGTQSPARPRTRWLVRPGLGLARAIRPQVRLAPVAGPPFAAATRAPGGVPAPMPNMS